jgi:DNA polymerase-1
VLIAAVPDAAGGARLRRVEPDGPVEYVDDLAAAVRASPDARWLWPSTAECYPRLVRAGVRVARCHDLELTEGLLLGYEGRWGEPKALPAVWARLTGAPVPPDPPPRPATPPGDGQATLFDPDPPPALGVDALIRGYRQQQARIDATADPARFRFLVAAESAGALLAVEMGVEGLPWRADVHDELLRDLLGEPSPVGGAPRRLAELSQRIADAFGGQRIHPESPAEVLRALRRAGISVPSTRAWVLRGVDHPAIPLLLEYKELYRIWTAHGWSWRQQWVRDGRFYPEYVPAGVVSGRWATRGGGALQIPKVIRRAVRADPGWTFVVADAGQLEPRVLAAVSGDPGMSRAAGAGDMYAVLATESFGGDRATAKVALLGAMYGQVGGQAAPGRRVRRPRALLAGPHVPARLGADLAGGFRGRARGGARPGPVHPQLRHPGHRRRVGAGAARPAPRRPSGPRWEAGVLPARRGGRAHPGRPGRRGRRRRRVGRRAYPPAPVR